MLALSLGISGEIQIGGGKLWHSTMMQQRKKVTIFVCLSMFECWLFAGVPVAEQCRLQTFLFASEISIQASQR